MKRKELHVIVHEDAVRAYADIGVNVAREVLEEIKQIKSSQEYLEIPSQHSPNRLHSDMPSTNDNLKVFVLGGYKETCCTMQLFKLKEAGYRARFHPTACCPGMGFLPSGLLKNIQKKYPDFYD